MIQDGDYYCCYLCNDMEKMSADELKQHFDSHHRRDHVDYRFVENFVKMSHVCDICAATFETVKEADEHIETHEDQYECSDCGRKFKKMLEYAMHNYEHTKSAKCELCNVVCKTKQTLHKHFAVHLASMNPYLCYYPECNKRYPRISYYHDHIKRHRGIRDWICMVCPSSFPTEVDLKTHVRVVHPEFRTGRSDNFLCTECNLNFKSNTSLSRHKMKVHNTVTHGCETCGKVFYSTHLLNKHAKLHGEKKLQCQYCEKTFHTRAGLIKHENVHTGTKQHKCRYCDKTFGTSGAQVIHERLHTNDRPYACEHCDKKYTAKQPLNMHKRSCKQGRI